MQKRKLHECMCGLNNPKDKLLRKPVCWTGRDTSSSELGTIKPVKARLWITLDRSNLSHFVPERGSMVFLQNNFLCPPTGLCWEFEEPEGPKGWMGTGTATADWELWVPLSGGRSWSGKQFLNYGRLFCKRGGISHRPRCRR